MATDLRERAISAWEAALRAAAERDVRARDSTAVCVAMDLRYATVDLDGEDRSWRFYWAARDSCGLVTEVKRGV
jgi:hypothetical protein